LIISAGNTTERLSEMPNPLRKLADDKELYVVMLPLWCDDVSGNRSKQYNKHINTYMVNSNLPGRLLQQEYFVRFVSTSPYATSPEQLSAVLGDIKYVHTYFCMVSTSYISQSIPDKPNFMF
jgi:hypothetical protein